MTLRGRCLPTPLVRYTPLTGKSCHCLFNGTKMLPVGCFFEYMRFTFAARTKVEARARNIRISKNALGQEKKQERIKDLAHLPVQQKA